MSDDNTDINTNTNTNTNTNDNTDNNKIDALKGAWDFVEGDDNDAYLRELGLGMMARMMGRGIKPRLIFSEQDGKWALRTESMFHTSTIEFTPDVEFEEKTTDGRELKGLIKFEDGKWVQKMLDKTGKESTTLRWVDENDQLQMISECGKAKVHRLYKRVQTDADTQ